MLSLSQMINNIAVTATGGGMQKLAQEAEGEDGDKKKKPPITKEEAERQATKEEARRYGDDTEYEKVSSLVTPEYAEKLASAVEYIIQSLVEPNQLPQGRVVEAQAAEQAASNVGAGKGAGANQTNLGDPTPGNQSDVTGQAKSQIPVKPAVEPGANKKNPDNAMGTNEPMMKPEWGEVMKQSSTPLYKYLANLVKEGEDAISPAKVSGSKTNALPEDEPSQVKRPAEVTSQERLISSNEAVPKATKREAKAVPKKRLKEVLDEPALTSSTDKVLDSALGAEKVDQAGAKIAAKKVKIAAARALLTKVASEGCKCGSKKGGCEFCKIAAWAGKKRGCLDKKSQITGVPPSVQVSGAGSATPPPPPPSGAPQR